MLDLKFVREHPEVIEDNLKHRASPIKLGALLDWDQERRRLLGEVEGLHSQKNKASEDIGRRKGKGEDTAPLIADMKGVSGQIEASESQLVQIEEKIHAS